MKVTKEDYPIKETAHKKKNFENQGMKQERLRNKLRQRSSKRLIWKTLTKDQRRDGRKRQLTVLELA